MTHFKTRVLQLFCHSGPPIAFQRKAVVFPYMGQKHSIVALHLAYWAATPPAIATVCDIQKMTECGLAQTPLVLINIRKPHVFCRAKKAVVFFSTSLSSLRMPPLTHASMCCRSRVSRNVDAHSHAKDRHQPYPPALHPHDF